MTGAVLRKRTTKWGVSVLRFVFLISFSYILLYPVFYMLSMALQSPADYADSSVVWIPKYFTTLHFEHAWKSMQYLKSLWNTIRFDLVAAVISVFSCAFYAYSLARFKMRGKSLMMVILILTILVPDIMVVIPRIANFKALDFLGILGLFDKLTGIDLRPNIVDSPLAFYLPSIFGMGLKGGLLIFIYMQFFKGLPRELEEAAWLDGAGPLQAFLRIILPSSGVVILTVFIFSIIWHWNDSLLAALYTYEERTLAVVLTDIKQHMYLQLGLASGATNINYYGVPLAACLMFIAPPLLLYMVLQRKFVQSIDRIGIVG